MIFFEIFEFLKFLNFVEVFFTNKGSHFLHRTFLSKISIHKIYPLPDFYLYFLKFLGLFWDFLTFFDFFKFFFWIFKEFLKFLNFFRFLENIEILGNFWNFLIFFYFFKFFWDFWKFWILSQLYINRNFTQKSATWKVWPLTGMVQFADQTFTTLNLLIFCSKKCDMKSVTHELHWIEELIDC